MIEFRAWPKTPRLYRDCTITEKLDGTNGGIHVEAIGPAPTLALEVYPLREHEVIADGMLFRVAAQSRNRLLSPGADNYGFGHWVSENAAQLALLLGPGLHYGEWWGQGIQRGYGLTGRRFSLFNTDVHKDVSANVGGVPVGPVPVLFRGAFDTNMVGAALYRLNTEGSIAAPGFKDPEGVIVYHHASRQCFKVTRDRHDKGKWEA